MNQVLLAWEKEESKNEKSIDDVISELYDIYQMKAQGTFENFESYCRLHILPYFTGWAISEVAPAWENFVAHTKKKRPGMRLGHLRRHLNKILSHAVDRGYLQAYPKLKVDSSDLRRDPISAYPKDEILRAIELAPENLRLKIEIAILTGCRPNEARLLKWDDIDFRSADVAHPGEVVKTRSGRRYPLPSRILRRLLIRKMKSRSDYVFPHRDNPERPETRSDKSWQRFKKEIGLRGKFYWFRHTHATIAIAEGTPQILVQKRMGTSAQMLERVYVRPSAEDAMKQANAVQASLFSDEREVSEEIRKRNLKARK